MYALPRGVPDDLLDFTIVYACTRDGVASLTQQPGGMVPADSGDLEPLVRTLLEVIPAPSYQEGSAAAGARDQLGRVADRRRPLPWSARQSP